MRATRRAFIGAAACLPLVDTVAVGAPAPGPACPAPRPDGVPPDRIARLARGFNLTGWLDRKPGVSPSRAVLKTLRGRGFTHVRLPVKAEFYLPDFVGSAPAAEQTEALDRALELLLALDFAVSLDMHPGEEIGALRKRDPDTAFRHLDVLWRHLLRRVRALGPERIFLEILNEPTDAAEYARAIGLARSVRAEAPRHTLIVGPPQWQRVEALEALTPLSDPNVVYAVHFYDPMAFTHQGLDWAGPDEPLTQFRDVPFPSGPTHPAILALRTRLDRAGRTDAARALAEQLAEPWDAARIDAVFAGAAAWSRRNRAPVIVNEFGVLSWKAPAADRAAWLGAVREAAERHCIGWTHWDYADGFGLARRQGDGPETLNGAIVEALVGRRG